MIRSYREEMIRAYPFHPELISVLYERWGTIPEFQRTRGVLRLLADVIATLYQSKDNEALIQSGSISLGTAAVRSELVKHTGHPSVYLSVIESDIAGSHAKAPEIDRQLGSEYAKESVSEKLARSVFMYSFSGGQQRGATLPQLRVGVLNPEMAPPFVSDALDRMTKRLWYLYHDNGLYRFDSRPNLNRILVDREELIRSEPDKVRDFAKTTLNDLIGDAAFRVYRYPGRGPRRGRRAAAEPRRPRSRSNGVRGRASQADRRIRQPHPQAARQGISQTRQCADLPRSRHASERPRSSTPPGDCWRCGASTSTSPRSPN